MSNAQAVATVTLALRELLFTRLGAELGAGVTTKPLDKARATDGNQLNLFLYRTTVDTALSNRDMPGAPPGESGIPPLALVLHYLVTAYGEDDDDALAHRLLGLAMLALHDHPRLGRGELDAVPLPGSDLHLQVERVRITPAPLSIDEVSKLWTTFQTPYRISAAYEASVVLIESARPPHAPLPVLRRDIGVRPGVTPPPFPSVDALVLPNDWPSARLGDTIGLSGTLLGATTTVRLSHPHLATPLEVPPVGGAVGDERVDFVLPDVPADVPAGTWKVAAELGAPDRVTNDLPLRVAPRVTNGLPADLVRSAEGSTVLDLRCRPEVRPDQPAFLLLSDRSIAAGPHPAPTASLRFTIPAAEPGVYYPVRVRIDGVDSTFVDWTTSPPTFDNSQRVTIT